MVRWTKAEPCVITHIYEKVCASPSVSMSTSIMTGFDWPFQVSRMEGGTGRVRDRLTTSPASFGRASVAEATQVLPAGARSLSATNNTAEAAKIVRFRIRRLRPDIRLEHRS